MLRTLEDVAARIVRKLERNTQNSVYSDLQMESVNNYADEGTNSLRYVAGMGRRANEH